MAIPGGKNLLNLAYRFDIVVLISSTKLGDKRRHHTVPNRKKSTQDEHILIRLHDLFPSFE